MACAYDKRQKTTERVESAKCLTVYQQDADIWFSVGLSNPQERERESTSLVCTRRQNKEEVSRVLRVLVEGEGGKS